MINNQFFGTFIKYVQHARIYHTNLSSFCSEVEQTKRQTTKLYTNHVHQLSEKQSRSWYTDNGPATQ